MSQLRRWLPLVCVTALLLLIAGTASIVDFEGSDVAPPKWGGPEMQESTSSLSSAPVEVSQSSDAGISPFLIVLLVVAGLAVAAFLIFLVTMIVRGLVKGVRNRSLPDVVFEEEAAELAPELEEVRQAVRASLADIDEGGDARRAVIACWLALERAAARAGVERLASETSGELVTRVLAAHHINPQALDRLAGMYRSARYAPHDVTGDTRDAARQALIELDAQLSAVPATQGVGAA